MVLHSKLVLLAVASACAGCSGAGSPHVYVMYPFGGIGDRSYSDAVYSGVVDASRTLDFTTTQVNPSSDDEAATTLASWLEAPAQSDEMIITLGFSQLALVKSKNCQFGGRWMVHLDDALAPCPSLKTVVYSVYPPSFLAGVAAMTVSSRKKASVIGGMNTEAIQRFIRGFVAGVTYAGGQVVKVEYVSESPDGFSNPSKAKQMAEAAFQDVDVVFPVAGGSGLGAFEAAKNVSGRYVLGVYQDQSWAGPNVVLGSVVTHLEVSVKDAIQSLVEHRLQGGEQTASLQNGGVEFVANPQFASRIQASVEAARDAAIAAGAADDQENPQ